MDDRQHLVEDDAEQQRRIVPERVRTAVRNVTGHKRFCLFLVVLALILAGHAIAIYFIYFHCNAINCVPIKVMSLNTWGMPSSLGSEYKEERMKGIAAELSKAEYDIYLFQELWMEADYYTIRGSVPKGYFMTEYRGLALSTCDGRLAPTACSGLAIVSKFPFQEIEFNSYTYHGDWTKAAIDGEWFARKGVGRVRIHPRDNITMDVFVTHTAADPDPRLHNYTNEWYRVEQVKELMSTYVEPSSADVVVLGGDFNAGPEKKKDSPYATVRQHMTNCIEEIFYKLNEWLEDTKFSTYGNPENTFSGHLYDPIIYDYIFYKTNTNATRMYTNWFELPLFKLKIFQSLSGTRQDEESATESEAEAEQLTEPAAARSKRDVSANGLPSGDKLISFSDHEAVISTIYMRF